jgi:hypothetical protein
MRFAHSLARCDPSQARQPPRGKAADEGAARGEKGEPKMMRGASMEGGAKKGGGGGGGKPAVNYTHRLTRPEKRAQAEEKKMAKDVHGFADWKQKEVDAVGATLRAIRVEDKRRVVRAPPGLASPPPPPPPPPPPGL